MVRKSAILRQPTALLPLVMSLGALGAVLGHIASAGIAPQADEGSAAHVWQLLMAGQLPLVAYFALRHVPRDPRRAVLVLALQIAAALAALAPVFLLRW